MGVVDIQGKRFGGLMAIQYIGGPGWKWECRCDCGNPIMISGDHLRQGRAKSCGCFRIDRAIEQGAANKKHGLCFTDGNYEPSNCRWATKAEQARNRRRAA